jgi:hypothetical protein
MPNPKRSTRFKLKTIVEALEWWLEGGYNGAKTNAVGAIVQREAQRILGVTGDMHFLKNAAKARLEGIMMEECCTKLQNKLHRELHTHIFTTPKLFKKPTRKEELENMTEDQIYKLFKKTQKAEIRKDRIKYILEAEKEYK